MPVEFLTKEQEMQYGNYPDELSNEQLAQYFWIDDEDKMFIFKRTEEYTQLGIALQLCTVRFLGTFLSNPLDVPKTVIDYLSNQLNISSETLSKYKDSKISKIHVNEICKKYGYSKFNEQPNHWRLIRWIHNRASLGNEKPIILFDLATNRCVENKVLLPGVTTLERLIAQIYERANDRLWKKLAILPDSLEEKKLLEILNLDLKSRKTTLDKLRYQSLVASPNGIIKALERLNAIRLLGNNKWDISKIPNCKLQKIAKYVSVVKSQIISRMPPEKRLAHLVAFVIHFSKKSQDDTISLIDKYLSELFKKTSNKGKKKRLQKGKNLSESMKKLLSAVEVLFDSETSDMNIRETIFKTTSEKELKKAFNKLNELADSLESNLSFHELFNHYSNIRKFLPILLETIEFKANSSSKYILEAWEFLKKEEKRKKKKFYKNAPCTGISEEWKKVVICNNSKVFACGYTFWVLYKLHIAIKNREIYLVSSEQFGNPESQLIQNDTWLPLKNNIVNTTKWSTSAKESLEPLIKELDLAYKYSEAKLDTNKYVRFEEVQGKSRLILTPLERREENVAYKLLKNKVQEMLPTIDLPILLLEVNKWTNFFDEFTHISGSNSRIEDLDISICAVLIAKACNVGFKPVCQKGIKALEYDRLLWVEQNYFRPETIALAKSKLNRFHRQLFLSQKWGNGEVVSADGKRLIIPVKSTTSRGNSKYFGVKKGITNYSLISDMYDELNFLLQPGATKDSIYLPQCVLEQQTSVSPKEVMTDTGGYSDLVFGIFGLLEYQFSPRISDIGSSRLWRIDKNADYGLLNNISRNKINLKLIYENWDEMLRVMASLKLGTVNATNLIRMLQRSGKPTMLGRSIIELGRIFKTLHQLQYIDDPDYRRAILTQLNKGESRNGLSDIVSYGKKGEMYESYQVAQEEQLGILGLVVNTIVHWNTKYMGVAVNVLEEKGFTINEIDVKHLSPLGSEHIIIGGKYSFIVPREIEEGKLRTIKL
ncbi:Tn3 family transposase [Candidatus Woesearchaeota archaeon]|nr:Tn3 family transposase [Candidatus Woesearchaeota archaeon]